MMTNETKEKILEAGFKILKTGGTALGAAIAGTIMHRVSEVKSRKKAKKLAVESNNKEK